MVVEGEEEAIAAIVVEAVEAVLGAEVYLYHFKVVMKDAGTFGDGERGDLPWRSSPFSFFLLLFGRLSRGLPSPTAS